MSVKKGNNDLQQLFQLFFGKHWPVWVGGILLGMLNILMFAIKSPWGASGGIASWGDNLYSILGLWPDKQVVPVTENLYGMLVLLIVLGSMAGAMYSKEFAIRVPPKGEMIKGIIGGVLMGIGATIGIGCSIGAFFSGVPALSGGALVFTFAMMAGVIVSLKYLLWEMENKPEWSSGKSFTFLSVKPDAGKWQVVAATILVIVILAYAWIISDKNLTMSWFIIIAGLMGLISQRSRFCIVKSFRDPFMSGESHGSVGVMAGLVVSLIGFTAIKAFGIGTIADTVLRYREMTWVYPQFWGRALIGGFIFGLGMTVAGGCAVGTLWRMGEGQLKLWFSGLGFTLAAPLSNKFVVPVIDSILPQSAKFKSYLPDYLGYGGSFLLILALILGWYVFVKWNERTGKFSAF